MKITFNVIEVASALQPLAQVVNKRNTLPILDDVLLKVNHESNTLELTASDTETQLTTYATLLESDVDDVICVNASVLRDALSNMKEQTLTLTTDDASHMVWGKYVGGVFKLPYENASEFPLLSSQIEGKTYVIASKSLETGIKNTIFSTTEDDLRPIFSCIYFDFDVEGLTFVATTGRMLAKTYDTSIRSDEKTSLVLPHKPANVLRNLLSSTSANVTMTFNDRNAVFTNESFSMICRLMDGRFPNYKSIIPSSSDKIVYISRASLQETLARTSVFAPTSELVVFNFKTNEVKVTCQDIDFAHSMQETLKCAYEGDELCIGFKYSILDAILRSMATDDVILKLTAPNAAALIEPFTKDESTISYMCLIMPMIVN